VAASCFSTLSLLVVWLECCCDEVCLMNWIGIDEFT